MPPMTQGAPPGVDGRRGVPPVHRRGSEHADAAAAYIDWMTSEHATELLLQTGQLPLARPRRPRSSRARCSRTWSTPPRQVSQVNGIVPYEDWATPTFYDTMTAAIQELMVNRISPEEFAAKVQADYAAFQSSRT